MKLLSKSRNPEKGSTLALRTTVVSLLAGGLILAAPFAPVVSQGSQAQAQEEEAAPRRKGTRVESIRQKHIKNFEKINEAFEIEDYATASEVLTRLEADPDLNNIEKSYIYQFKGNIAFTRDDLQGALREFKKITTVREGIPINNYNQNLYVIAQVYFSLENYSEALNYARQWFNTQEEPTADGYMLIGQAQYMLQRYDDALPNVQKGINKYVEVGSIPKEGWLNLLSNIYRQKDQFAKMVPVLKQLVQHYPKKTYIITLAGVYNELDQQSKMTALYQALYDQDLLASESELVTLASLKLAEDNPYKASQIMKKGIDAGVIKRNLKNYRLYSQALYASKEYESALAPLSEASKLSDDGKLYDQLGQSYLALNRWAEAETALKRALNKGGLGKYIGTTKISLGSVQFEQKKYEEAKKTFQSAAQHDSVSDTASRWARYVDNEVLRIATLKEEIIINTDVEPLPGQTVLADIQAGIGLMIFTNLVDMPSIHGAIQRINMSSNGLSKMKIKLSVIACAVGLSLASTSFADPTDDLVNSGLARSTAGAASQTRIDQIADATDSIIRRYQQQAKVVENLRAYNDRMRRTLVAQEEAMLTLEQSIEDASLIERQIVPLMLRMIEGLDVFVKADVPFQQEDRQARVDRIRGYLTNANISAAERFRQVLQAYSIEAGYGKTLNVYTDSLEVEGEMLAVNVLQVGRTGLYYQTLDGSQSGHWDRETSAWQPLASSHNEGINHAIRVMQGKEPSETLLELPIAAPEVQ